MEFLVTVRPSEGATPTVALAVEREFPTSFDAMVEGHCLGDKGTTAEQSMADCV